MINLFFFMGVHIQNQILKIILSVTKIQETVTDNPLSITRYIRHKLEKGITFKTKTRYYLHHLPPENMKFFGSNTDKIIKNQKYEKFSHLGIVDVLLAHCNIANNDYLPNLRILYAFVLNKVCRQLLDISPKNVIFLKNFHSKFPFIKLWFTDKDYRRNKR